jgi:hypothetical protein
MPCLHTCAQGTRTSQLFASIAAKTTGYCLHFVSSFDPVPRSMGPQVTSVIPYFKTGYLKVCDSVLAVQCCSACCIRLARA